MPDVELVLMIRASLARPSFAGGNLDLSTHSSWRRLERSNNLAQQQSASTGLPVALCRANMKKNQFVLGEMRSILTSLTRGLALDVLSRGYGEERNVPISFQAESPVLGLVLPSNSPGVHTLWMPIIPLQIGLVLKPGPQEPWTPWRMSQAFFQAGIPKQAISIYPGAAEVGAAVLSHCPKTLIFGSTATVERYHGNPAVQVHGHLAGALGQLVLEGDTGELAGTAGVYGAAKVFLDQHA